MSILIVDDEETLLDILHRILKAEGYEIVKAASAEEALQVLANNRTGIEMVIADYYMPGLSGLELLQTIRAEDSLLPIIIMTAYADKDLILQAFRSRCDGFIEKPFTPDILFSEINRAQQSVIQETALRVNNNLQVVSDCLQYAPSVYAEEHPGSLKITPKHLQETQKMEILGTLAGGIAHDFNNLLQAIQGQIELLLLDITQENPGYAGLKEVEEAASRGAELASQLLSFARKAETKFQPVNLNDIIIQAKGLLQRVMPKNINIDLQLASNLPAISADPIQLEQVLFNLAINARDAMPTGGNLILSTAALAGGETTIGLPSGDYVELSVSDAGCGMNQKVLQHIFEPFYTTKEIGQGTGLGLAMVDFIVKCQRGKIRCTSEVGMGTMFQIFWPASIQNIPQKKDKNRGNKIVQNGNETILLVDDDAMVRQVISLQLQNYGYQILEASNYQESWLLNEHYQGTVHLLLTDVGLTDRSGFELAEFLTAQRPELKVLIMSGNIEKVVASNNRLEQRFDFLAKPFKHADLARKVRAVLDGPNFYPATGKPSRIPAKPRLGDGSQHASRL